MTFHWWQVFDASYAAWIILETWISLRDRHRRSGTSGDRGSLLVLIASLAAAILAAWYAAVTQRWARIEPFHFALFLAGLALVWAGMAFRLWAVLTLGKFFRTTVMVQDEHRLVESGPYRWLRHPAYTGTMMTLMGFGLGFGNWISLALLTIVPLLAYGYRISVEERALRARFGPQFDAYARVRWRLIPFLV
jgi:protein-S-isoprenylcysteine O-methyltransferase